MGMISKKAGGASALGFALGAAMMMAQPAIAAETFDFAGLANLEEDFWSDFTPGSVTIGGVNAGAFSSSGIWTKGGIGVSASASNSSGLTTPASFAYLDGNTAGLGVCSSGNNSGNPVRGNTGNQCGTSSDDNAGLTGDNNGGFFETLILDFGSQTVKLDSLVFRNRGHGVYDPNGAFQLAITDAAGTNTGNVNYLIGTGLVGSVFEFSRIAGLNNVRDFYLSSATVSAVPLPAGILLLGSALGGLGLMGRRRKAA